MQYDLSAAAANSEVCRAKTWEKVAQVAEQEGPRAMAKTLWRTLDDWLERYWQERLWKPPCHRGCAYCCKAERTGGSTLPVELLVIIAEVPEAKIPRLLKSKREAWTGGCPFLYAHECSIYTVRPMACRGYFGHTVDTCRSGFTKNSGVERVDTGALWYAAVWRFLGARIAEKLGWESGRVDLADGLRRVFKSSNLRGEPLAEELEARYRQGERLFDADPVTPMELINAVNVGEWIGTL